MPFSQSQEALLTARIDEARVHTRRKQGLELRYLEGHDVIDAANEVFGFHGWGYTVTKLESQQGVWIATLLVTVNAGGDPVMREDVGVGIAAIPRDSDQVSPDANETAIKGAVTDALKRALRTFGNAFGNSLYDKEENAAANAARQNGNGEAVSQAARTAQQPGGDVGETRLCPSCDEPMSLHSGTTRDGRPYSAYFCSAKCGQKPIWLAERKADVPVVTQQQAPAQARIMEAADTVKTQANPADRILTPTETKAFRQDVTNIFRQAGWRDEEVRAAVAERMTALGLADVTAVTLRGAADLRQWATAHAAGGGPAPATAAEAAADAAFEELGAASA
jgi:DNA repair and recombination protein RAD52